MSYLRHILACNRHDPARYRPFVAGGLAVGRVRHELADALARHDDLLAVSPAAVVLPERYDDPAARTEAMAALLGRMRRDGLGPRPRGEHYAVMTRWGAPPVMTLDRAAVAHFGIPAYGLHVNGYVRRSDGLHLWVGRRARDRGVAPGQLDNLIAGGQPAGLSLRDNLVKEAGEEAGLTPEQALAAVPVGAVRYVMENEHGLKPDTLFLYDLELPEGFEPRNTDGEVEEFMLWPVERVARSVRDGDEWKFNCNLVVIDFLIRHGVITPEEPDYLDLVTGLRR